MSIGAALFLPRRAITIRPESHPVNRQPLSVDADVSVKKDLCQPSAGQDVVGDGRYDEPALTCRQCRKGDDLVCSKPIQRCTGREIVEQLFGDALPDRLRTSSQGPR